MKPAQILCAFGTALLCMTLCARSTEAYSWTVTIGEYNLKHGADIRVAPDDELVIDWTETGSNDRSIMIRAYKGIVTDPMTTTEPVIAEKWLGSAIENLHIQARTQLKDFLPELENGTRFTLYSELHGVGAQKGTEFSEAGPYTLVYSDNAGPQFGLWPEVGYSWYSRKGNSGVYEHQAVTGANLGMIFYPRRSVSIPLVHFRLPISKLGARVGGYGLDKTIDRFGYGLIGGIRIAVLGQELPIDIGFVWTGRPASSSKRKGEGHFVSVSANLFEVKWLKDILP